MEKRNRDRLPFIATYISIGLGMALMMILMGDAAYTLPITILGGFGLWTAVRFYEQTHYPAA